jgi:hypothetical protein
VIDGDLADGDVVSPFWQPGCRDTTLKVEGGLGYREFRREALSFADAVVGAISQVESVDGVSVRRLEPDDVVTVADIAERLDSEQPREAYVRLRRSKR